jgi:lipid-binding SYLF domain-containing protein
MRNRVALSTLLMGLALAFTTTTQVHAQAREQGRLLMATEVLEEIRASRDSAIPDRLLDRAYGIVVVPNVTKLAFIAGGRWGKGALVVRDKNGNFTSPIFVNLAGASVGWQWGGTSTDIVLVFTTRAGIEGITGGKLTLGADAAVAAGPVGRSASAATDQNFAAEVYSYDEQRRDGAALPHGRGIEHHQHGGPQHWHHDAGWLGLNGIVHACGFGWNGGASGDQPSCAHRDTHFPDGRSGARFRADVSAAAI